MSLINLKTLSEKILYLFDKFSFSIVSILSSSRNVNVFKAEYEMLFSFVLLLLKILCNIFNNNKIIIN